VATWVQAHGCTLNVEIKPTPGTESATGAAVAAACAALWAGAAVPPLLSSFAEVALQAAQAAAPTLPRALLLDTLPPDPVARAQALGCVAVVTQHRLMDGPLRAALHAAGLRALCYTVNDDAEVRRLQALGVDGLITDAVDRYRPAEPRRTSG
jgi:glycerophosphoryl diester phosphodiesterase